MLPAAVVGSAPTRRATRSARGGNLVLRLHLEVAGVVALVQLARRLTGGAVDHPPALHGRPCPYLFGPALNILVFMDREEFASPVTVELHQTAIPRPDGDVGNCVFGTGDVLALGQTLVEHI